MRILHDVNAFDGMVKCTAKVLILNEIQQGLNRDEKVVERDEPSEGKSCKRAFQYESYLPERGQELVGLRPVIFTLLFIMPSLLPTLVCDNMGGIRSLCSMVPSIVRKNIGSRRRSRMGPAFTLLHALWLLILWVTSNLANEAQHVIQARTNSRTISHNGSQAGHKVTGSGLPQLKNHSFIDWL
jgi:hypothetical protein